MVKEIVNQIQEAERVPYRINPRINMPRHILIKLTKNKNTERILKASREKQQIEYSGNLICLMADLSAEILQDRREWQDVFKILKEGNIQPRLLYLARISVKIDGKIKSFFRQAKVKRIQYHQTSVRANVKRIDIVKIHKRRK